MRWGSTTPSQPWLLAFGLAAHLLVQSFRSTAVYPVPFLFAPLLAMKAQGQGHPLQIWGWAHARGAAEQLWCAGLTDRASAIPPPALSQGLPFLLLMFDYF